MEEDWSSANHFRNFQRQKKVLCVWCKMQILCFCGAELLWCVAWDFYQESSIDIYFFFCEVQTTSGVYCTMFGCVVHVKCWYIQWMWNDSAQTFTPMHAHKGRKCDFTDGIVVVFKINLLFTAMYELTSVGLNCLELKKLLQIFFHSLSLSLLKLPTFFKLNARYMA